MPSALPPADPGKQWWSISRSSSSKDLRQKSVQDSQPQRPTPQVKSSGKFNSFASVIGFKSKKPHPSLAIQDPPMTMNSNANVVSLPSPSPLSDTTRPTSTSKSTSSTRSRVDSMPRTPVDSHRDHRHSLLTLSDSDPFAGRLMIAVPVPHLPSDPNRLSAYSNPSVTDLVQRKGDPPTFNRISYASSSSNSHNHALDIPSINSPVSSKERQEFRELRKKRSIPSMQSKQLGQLQTQASLLPTTGSRNRSGSSTTGSDSHSMQMADGPTRPKLRARGMTDTATSHQAGFFVEERSSARKLFQKSPSASHGPSSPEFSGPQERPISPRVVIRQASSSRLQHPPSAPPTHRLPPPPRSPSKDSSNRPSSSHSQVESPISSSMSFSSAISLTNDMFANPPFAYVDDDKGTSGRSIFSQNTYDELEISMFENEPRTAPSSPRTLKKALSQQSLSRRFRASPPPIPKTPPDSQVEKGNRKQRTFHHPRLPIPPIPLPSLASTSGFTPTPFPCISDSGTSPVLERRRTSTASSTGRRRLFSHSSQNRPSTAQPSSTTDDDSFSLFSLRSDAESHHAPHRPSKTSTNKSIPTSSFWEEGSSENMPHSPVRSNYEYTPQAIMSKADLAKLEASVDNSPLKSTRARGFSVLSASTVASDLDNGSEIIPIGLSPPPPPSRSNYTTRMSTSSAKKSPASSSLPQRPHTSPISDIPVQNDIDDNFSQATSSAVSQVTIVRPRTPPALISLPPPPRRQRPTLLTQPEILEGSRIRGPPSAKSAKAGSMRISTVEKAMHRKSIMRKASFLEIDDETDQETEPERVDERINGSFLDLARESFDSTRSDT
ncbi:hypothetical protein CVT25_005725 [Psilocybe cyanescens]|uniref:Uncharacterized protein n=1 Tax=Psilocybe cyanescens TaxID=93625 RepID=A0A409VLH9_PSICY|nr:hypothetical protein CVT25_005725 [Psilocybe cyanescens]